MYVWDLRHVVQPVRQLQGHREYIKGFEVAGRMLYSCSFDGTVKAWSLDTFVRQRCVVVWVWVRIVSLLLF